MANARCHDDRPHYARGYCRVCYKSQWLYKRNPKARARKKATARAWWLRNRDKVLARQRKRYADNRQTCAEQAYGYRLQAKFGLSLARYRAMLEACGGTCEVCRESQTKRLHVDHDHATGRVRGLLCSRCNVTLGAVGDAPKLLRALADYLERP